MNPSIELGNDASPILFLYIVPRLGLCCRKHFIKSHFLLLFCFCLPWAWIKGKKEVFCSFPHDDGEGGDKATCPVPKNVHSPVLGAGEVAQWLRALVGLAEDPDLIFTPT